MLNGLVPLLRELIFSNKITSAIALAVALYLGFRWNYIETGEIVTLLISALSLGLSRDPVRQKDLDHDQLD